MNTTPPTLADVRAEVFHLYAARDWAGALALLERVAPHFTTPPQIARVAFWRACFLALSNQHDDAIHALEDGLRHGAWWSPQQLRSDPDLAWLQALPAFIAIVAECERRLEAAQPSTQPVRLVAEPARADPPMPLLLALHGYGSNAEETLPYWVGAAQRGWRVAALQSSQLAGIDGYHWVDEARGLAEVKQQVAELSALYAIDREKLVIGGFSNGSRLALTAALTPDFHVPLWRVVCVAGGLRGEAFDALDYAALRARTLPRITAIVGANDDQSSLGEQAQRLIAEGLPVDLQVVPGMGHTYPLDFDARLTALLME
jgi:predicted esterase